jgi:hypothetical protein
MTIAIGATLGEGIVPIMAVNTLPTCMTHTEFLNLTLGVGRCLHGKVRVRPLGPTGDLRMDGTRVHLETRGPCLNHQMRGSRRMQSLLKVGLTLNRRLLHHICVLASLTLVGKRARDLRDFSAPRPEREDFLPVPYGGNYYRPVNSAEETNREYHPPSRPPPSYRRPEYDDYDDRNHWDTTYGPPRADSWGRDPRNTSEPRRYEYDESRGQADARIGSVSGRSSPLSGRPDATLRPRSVSHSDIRYMGSAQNMSPLSAHSTKRRPPSPFPSSPGDVSHRYGKRQPPQSTVETAHKYTARDPPSAGSRLSESNSTALGPTNGHFAAVRGSHSSDASASRPVHAAVLLSREEVVAKRPELSSAESRLSTSTNNIVTHATSTSRQNNSPGKV